MDPLPEWSDEDRRHEALLRLCGVVLRDTPQLELGARELAVVNCASHGLTVEETAVVMGTTLETVKAQRAQAQRKLRAKNICHAACIAVRAGLIA